MPERRGCGPWSAVCCVCVCVRRVLVRHVVRAVGRCRVVVLRVCVSSVTTSAAATSVPKLINAVYKVNRQDRTVPCVSRCLWL